MQRLSGVALNPKDSVSADEADAVEHERDDVARRVELSQAVAIDRVDVLRVKGAEDVGVEPAERLGHQPVQNLDECSLARPVPVVVVLTPVQPRVLLAAVQERFPEHVLDVLLIRRVPLLEPSVVEVLRHELHVFPRAIEEDPRQREVGDSEEVLSPHALGESLRRSPCVDRVRQRRDVCSRSDLEREHPELVEQSGLPGRIHCEKAIKSVGLRSRVLLKPARKKAQSLDERIDVDLWCVVRVEPTRPARLMSDPNDLLRNRKLLVRELRAEAFEPLDVVGGHRFAAGELPERKDAERQVRVMADPAGGIDAKLGQVEEDAAIESSLGHVVPNLGLVRRQLLGRALGVEDKRMREQVVGREIRLATALAKLLEDSVLRKAEYAAEDQAQNRLRQDLLVRSDRRGAEVVAKIRSVAELPVLALELVENPTKGHDAFGDLGHCRFLHRLGTNA